MCSKREPFHALLPLLRHVVPLNDGNCHLTIPVVKGRCAREALPHHTTIKHIYNESENLNGSCDVVLTATIGGIFHNNISDWRGECGDTRWPSFHTRLLDAGHM